MDAVLVSTAAGLATYIIMPSFLHLLKRGGASRRNYRGVDVPLGAGFLFIWMGSLMGGILGLSALLSPSAERRAAADLWLLLSATGLGYSLLGLLDDLVGDRRQTGLLGHARAFITGQLTTGAVKAVAGLAFGFVLAGCRLSAGEFRNGTGAAAFPIVLMDGLLIAAGANTLNLFDLRPGRAGKVFLLGWVLILCGGNPVALAMLPWIGSLLGYLPFDLRGLAMMGDVGSNALGALLGMASSLTLAPPGRLAVLVVLALLHLLAERISFSEVIESHHLLRRLDLWGRRES